MIRLFEYFTKKSFQVNLISLAILGFGYFALKNTPLQFLPKTDEAMLFMSIQHGDYNIYQMEEEFTFPIEERLLNLPEIKNIYTSTRKRSANFNIYIKNLRDKEKVSKEIQKIAQEYSSKLPNGMEDIRFERFWNNQELGWLTVGGADYLDTKDREEVLRTLREIGKVPGVNNVAKDIPNRHIYIDIDSSKSHFYRISPQEVKDVLREIFRTYPMGAIRKNGKRINVSLEKRIDNLQKIKDAPISVQDGRRIYLKDIAQISYMRPPPTQASIINGKVTRWFRVEGTEEANIIKTNKEIRELIERKNKESKRIQFNLIYSSDLFLTNQVSLLKNNALIGFLLVFLALFSFLSFKLSLSVLFGLPVVYALCFIFLDYFSISIDLVSITGMILVIGILVDDAIIVAEKYIHELEKGLNRDQAIQQTLRSTFFPITGSILTTIIAFYPIAYGNEGEKSWFWGFFMVILLSLLASWFESFFILPNHLHHWVKKPSAKKSSLWKPLTKSYESFTLFTLKFRYGVIPLLALFVFLTFKFPLKSFSPSFNFNLNTPKIEINIELDKQIDLEEFQKSIKEVTLFFEKLKSQKRIEGYHMNWGRKGGWGERISGREYAKMQLVFNPSTPKIKDHVKEIEKEVRSYLENNPFPHLKTFDLFDQRISLRNQEDVIRFEVESSNKLDLSRLYSELKLNFLKIEGIKEIIWPDSNKDFLLEFTPKQEALKEQGISFYSLSEQLRPYLSYQYLRHFRFNSERTFIYLGIDNPIENDLSQQDKILIYNTNNLQVPLSSLGSWQEKEIIKKIKHWDMKREIDFYFRFDKENVKDFPLLTKNLKKAAQELEKKFSEVKFIVHGESESRRKNRNWLTDSFAKTIGLVLLVLMLTMQSLVLPFLVIMAIPFGLLGLAWALYLHGMQLEFVGLIGLIGMCGVVVNDSLLMIDAIKSLTQNLSYKEAIITGASSRLRAICLTTITTLCGVFPIMYGIGGDAGYTKGLIFSLGWGILSSTLMILFILPSLVCIFFDIYSFLKKLVVKHNPLNR